MDRVFSYDLKEDFIARVADYIEEKYSAKSCDFSRLAIVFGGRRPALFLRRELARRFKQNFFPPVFFSIDQLVERIISEKESFSLISDLDACFSLYKTAKNIAPDILGIRETFASFLPWAREILRFIEHLDLEDVEISKLSDIQLHADIGYDVPESINVLLSRIVCVAEDFRKVLLEKKSYTRGMMYRLASGYIQEVELDVFDDFLFCNFFYLHKTEEKIIKSLYDRQRSVLFFQGASSDWSVLSKVSKNLSVPIEPVKTHAPEYTLNIQAGFDVHAQVCLVRDILKKVGSPEKTVIVLPEPEHIVPLLSEISSVTENFNVSMGYPVKRSLLYSFFDSLFKAQATKKDGQYYVKDYIRLLSHPLVKNWALEMSPQAMRILVHKIEEYFAGIEKSVVGGALFVRLSVLEGLEDLYASVSEMCSGIGMEPFAKADVKRCLVRMHEFLFIIWEHIDNLGDFASCCEKLLDMLTQKSMLSYYPFNLKIAAKIYDILSEFKNAVFNQERFLPEECFDVFQDKLEHEALAFSGSPLKGLQILGLFETRCLNFENVIFMDVNESVLPKLKIYEPLVPRDVMISLGLNRLEKEEEIQRYQFMRLISHAKNVFLLYQEGAQKEKSRFIEDLVWQRQKACQRLDVIPVNRGVFTVKVLEGKVRIDKTEPHVAFLKNHCYSASSIDTYLYCPLRFYYRYCLGLNEKQSWRDELEAHDIGNFVHLFLEEAFSRFVGRTPVIDSEFRYYFFNLFDCLFEEKIASAMRSDAFLVKEVLRNRLEKFLDQEASRPVKEILFLEKKFTDHLTSGHNQLLFECRMDRVDRLSDDSLLILDYKTGSSDVRPLVDESFDLSSRQVIKEHIKSFQLPLYIYFLRKQFQDVSVNAALYNLRELNEHASLKKFFESADQKKNLEMLDRFMRALDYLVREIFDLQIPFEADENEGHRCAHCPYFYLCR